MNAGLSRRILLAAAPLLLGPPLASAADPGSPTQPAATPPASLSPAAQPLSDAQRDAIWDSRGCIDDRRGQWFRDAKFGTIIHFGLYSQLGGYFEGKGPYRPAEQIMGLGDRRSVISAADYKAKVGSKFNPEKFDAAQWVSLVKKAGQKYLILTTKHHDGFCMFKTATTPYNVVDATPFGRDVIKEVSQECRKQGIEFCLYYSIGDWCAADVMDPAFPSYREYMFAQIRELLTNYPDVKLLWLDNYWYVDDQWSNDEAHARDLYSFARSVRPGILVNDRCGSGAESSDGDYATPENQLRGSLQSRYFEVVMTNTADDNWGWVRGATNYRKPAELIRNLIDSVSKGGNFVLNVGPTGSGEFPPEHVAVLEAMGAWTSVNGEALYATIPAPELSAVMKEGARRPVVYATRSKDGAAHYAHVVAWPADGAPLTLRLHGETGPLHAALLDPALGKLTCMTRTEDGDTLATISAPAKLDPYATVIKLTRPPAPSSVNP